MNSIDQTFEKLKYPPTRIIEVRENIHSGYKILNAIICGRYVAASFDSTRPCIGKQKIISILFLSKTDSLIFNGDITQLSYSWLEGDNSINSESVEFLEGIIEELEKLHPTL